MSRLINPHLYSRRYSPLRGDPSDVAYWQIASYRCDTEFSRCRGMVDIGQACTHQARFVSTRPGPTGRYPGHEYCFAKG